MNYNIYNPNNNQDPNKIKKCECEDKYGPKPFSPKEQKTNSNKPN